MARRTRRNGFGSIYSVGTPTHPAFFIRWQEGSKRRKQSGFSTRKEAAEALARVRVGLGDGTLVEKRRGSMSFDVAAKEWLELHSKPNLRSHTDNEERYRKHVAPFFGDAPLNSIVPARILELRAKLQTHVIVRKRRDSTGKVVGIPSKMKPRTVNLVLALVRSILRFAVANGHIFTSPTDRIGRGKLMLPVERTKLASPIEKPEDVWRLLAAIGQIGDETNRPGLYPLFALLVYTGLRRGEALGLRWCDMDLDRRMIIVRRSYDAPTKSGKHRTVGLPPELVAIMQGHRPVDHNQDDLCFPNDVGEMYSRNAKLEDVWHEALRRIQHPRIRVHDSRHAFASLFVMGGGDIFTLQKILGHSTPQLTSDTYAHLSPAHLAGVADRVSYPAPAEASAVILAFHGVTG